MSCICNDTGSLPLCHGADSGAASADDTPLSGDAPQAVASPESTKSPESIAMNRAADAQVLVFAVIITCITCITWPVPPRAR
ncbi:MAG: hypothetical protein DRJ42_04800 [Deltaproteobacteria bacterium]|nr:MAG: hypothetical protein DRJ42_04800 [Deltaproteobacteria bacterium]